MILPMDTSGSSIKGARPPHREDTTERQRRVAREAELLAKARTSAAAGRTVSEAQVDAWIDSLGTDHELPLPRSDR